MNVKIVGVVILLYATTVISGCVQCGNRQNKHLGQINSDSFTEQIMYLDSLRWLTGGSEYPLDITVDIDSLKMSWTGFAKLYSAGEYYAAYEFLKKDQKYPNVLIYLRNSTAQFEFISTAWNVCVSAHAQSDEEYFKEIEEEYLYVLYLTKAVVEMGGKDPYVPPHYMDMVMELGRLILTMKDYERGEAFDEEIYFAAKSMYGDERMARFLGLAFRCPYLCRIGKESQARRELDAFRNKVKRECSGEELEKLLSAINATERDMTNIE